MWILKPPQRLFAIPREQTDIGITFFALQIRRCWRPCGAWKHWPKPIFILLLNWNNLNSSSFKLTKIARQKYCSVSVMVSCIHKGPQTGLPIKVEKTSDLEFLSIVNHVQEKVNWKVCFKELQKSISKIFLLFRFTFFSACLQPQSSITWCHV